MITTGVLHSPVVTSVTLVMVTPTNASTILPVSPIHTCFGFLITHAPPTAAFGEGARLASDPKIQMEEDIEHADIGTEVGPPQFGEEEELRLPSIQTLPPIEPYDKSVVE
ncbi:hypothetical protein FS749_006844 [Ceratobasidium sp. UAMH 11750]|nr:hypothetical protein FS749_006844 [Ceratobasidium sp. UAMH 11750]